MNEAITTENHTLAALNSPRPIQSKAAVLNGFIPRFVCKLQVLEILPHSSFIKFILLRLLLFGCVRRIKLVVF